MTETNTSAKETPKPGATAAPNGSSAGTATADAGQSQNIDIVLDIPVTLSMELGRTRMSIRDLLKLKNGSVLELQKMVHEPLDVLVNGTLVARGEAVVVDDRFGVRLTDVISPMERVKKLK